MLLVAATVCGTVQSQAALNALLPLPHCVCMPSHTIWREVGRLQRPTLVPFWPTCCRHGRAGPGLPSANCELTAAISERSLRGTHPWMYLPGIGCPCLTEHKPPIQVAACRQGARHHMVVSHFHITARACHPRHYTYSLPFASPKQQQHDYFHHLT